MVQHTMKGNKMVTDLVDDSYFNTWCTRSLTEAWSISSVLPMGKYNSDKEDIDTVLFNVNRWIKNSGCCPSRE